MSSSSAAVRPAVPAALFLSTLRRRQRRDHEVPLDREHAARAHHQPAHDGGPARPRRRGRTSREGDAARADGPDRRSARAWPARSSGGCTRGARTPRARPSTRSPSPSQHCRHAADLHGADPHRPRRRARLAGALRHRVPLPRAGRRGRHDDGARPAARAASTRSARSTSSAPTAAARSRAGHRPAVRGRWTGRADQHRLRGRPHAPRRAPAERPVLGAAARAPTSAASAWASSAWCARGTSGSSSGATTSTSPRPSSTTRPRSRSRATSSATTTSRSRSSPPRPGVNNMWYATSYTTRPGVLHRRRRAPAPAEQRPGLQHLDPGRVQPRLEARPRRSGQGRRRASRHLPGRARADRQADRRRGPTRASTSPARSSTRWACSTRATRT